MNGTRIYLVTCEGGRLEPMLVRARTRHIALRYVIGRRYETKLASQEDLEEYLQMGLRVLHADDDGSDDEPDEVDPRQLDIEEAAHALP
jgi:hypothetical protein